MTVDRDQIRRDAEALLAANPDYGESVVDGIGYDECRFAAECLALLAELEQAERIAEQATFTAREENDLRTSEHEQYEARLAKVPALVEMLRHVDEALDRGAPLYPSTGTHPAIKAALRAWESE